MYNCFFDILNGTALPPMQVGVWIPKTKMGPEAENFRPLGMPNTLDRLVDGSVPAHVMKKTAHLMHPSQAVTSCFKEPQKAVSCIQKILDGEGLACTLLADLSKAFERVNLHWILELLRIKRAPRWLIAYTKFILFTRRVSHKVQGRLLPSRTIKQGVDMGRSFSVYGCSFGGHQSKVLITHLLCFGALAEAGPDASSNVCFFLSPFISQAKYPKISSFTREGKIQEASSALGSTRPT